MYMSYMLLASFADRDNAGRAVDALEASGFEAKDISVITKDTGIPKDSSVAANMADGAAEGAVTGSVVGGLAGLLAGAGVIPALAGLLIGGPIAAALGATGIAAATISGAVTGAVAGGLIGALTGIGVSEEDARYYDKTVNEGGMLVAVPVDGDGEEAREILETAGAGRISSVKTSDAATVM